MFIGSEGASMDFLFGYDNKRLTEAELNQRSSWSLLHPEFRRRLIALFKDSQANRSEVGFGGGWRSSEAQKQLFLSRYHESRIGLVKWDGKRWAKNKGVADAAPPGRSYHESTDSNNFAFAADLVGDMVWMNANCHRFGLIHFGRINKEPWHVQPQELPASRSKYKNETLSQWVLPNETNEDIDMIVLDYMKGTTNWIALLWTGDTIQWIVNGHAYSVLENAGVKRIDVTKSQLLGVIGSSKAQGNLPGNVDKDIAAAWDASKKKS
jgi:hypothetical protein